MLNNLSIKGFKNIAQQTLELRPLTLITGLNSTGKSSVLQSLLLLAQHSNPANQYSMSSLNKKYSNFLDVRNKYTSAKAIHISAQIKGNNTVTIKMENDQTQAIEQTDQLIYDEQLYYLNANRIGQEDLAEFGGQKVGSKGEHLFGTFEASKSDPIALALCYFSGSQTLSYQLYEWLKLITGMDAELKTEKIISDQVRVSFNSEGIDNISPYNLGASFSYLAKVLMICLIAKPGNVILLENPEIHLHPKAQSKMGILFAFVASKGVQLIIETHCEHLIHQCCYQIYTDNLSSKQMMIHYKSSVQDPFVPIEVNENGHYTNQQGDATSFPKGFFDTSLSNLLDMG